MPRFSFVLFSMFIAASAFAQRGAPARRPQPQPTPTPVIANAGDAIGGLTSSQAADFAAGLEEFSNVETVADGLGPVFNGRSCAECHEVPVVGGGSSVHLVTRIGRRVNGAFDPLTELGGSLIHDHAIGPPDVSSHLILPECPSAHSQIVYHLPTPPLY